jgi:hypothetical protein
MSIQRLDWLCALKNMYIVVRNGKCVGFMKGGYHYSTKVD